MNKDDIDWAIRTSLNLKYDPHHLDGIQDELLDQDFSEAEYGLNVSFIRDHNRTEMDWLSPDTKERFNTLSENHPDYPQSHRDYYLKNPVTYMMNKYGFRTDPLERCVDKDCIVFLGCSLTWGAGVQKELTWTSLVSNALNKKEVNLGVCGGSYDTAFRVYNAHGSKVKHSHVIMMMPPGIRFEIVNTLTGNRDDEEKPHFIQMGAWSFNSPSPYEHASRWVVENSSMAKDIVVQNIIKNLYAIDYMATKNGAKFILINHANIVNAEDWYHNDDYPEKARDYGHPGANWHSIRATEIIKMLDT